LPREFQSIVSQNETDGWQQSADVSARPCDQSHSPEWRRVWGIAFRLDDQFVKGNKIGQHALNVLGTVER
jgi:hypothetical protein